METKIAHWFREAEVACCAESTSAQCPENCERPSKAWYAGAYSSYRSKSHGMLYELVLIVLPHVCSLGIHGALVGMVT